LRLLLDTCAAIWWCFGSALIPQPVRARVIHPENDVFVSVISPWEVAIKEKLDRFAEFPPGLGERFRAEVARHGFEVLPVNWEHGMSAGALPLHHRDPFDRMLVAQAQVEGLTLVSPDEAFAPYEIERLWG